MQIAIVTKVDMLVSGAVRNRLISYARGIAELGTAICMICLENSNSQLQSIRFDYTSISFYGVMEEQTTQNKLFTFLFSYIHGRRAALLMKEIQQNERIEFCIIYGMLIPERIPILNQCRKLNISLIDEITEFPYIGRENKIYRRIQYYLFINHYLVKDAGILCISTAIKEFIAHHLERVGVSKPIMIFGIMVESDKYHCIDPKFSSGDKTEEYVAYCGSMYGDKDGIPILIEAFSLVKARFPQMKLYIIGDNSNKDKFQPILNQVTKFELTQSVIFTGRISWEVMHSYLCGARALALAKPGTKQNEGAFPTKLGEYLACGKPVVTTSVGDIPLYLKDGENAYLAVPGDSEDFARKLIECLENKDQADTIAANGRKLAETVFNYRNRANELLHFLGELLRNRE